MKNRILALCLLFALSPVSAQDTSSDDSGNIPGFKIVKGWPQLPGGFEFGKVSAVAVDSKGRVYIGHRGEHPIMLFDAAGSFIRSQGERDILLREAVVYEPREGEHAVLSFRRKGESTWDAERKILYSESARFTHGIHVDYQDNLWVTDVGQSIVLKYNPDGVLLEVLGTADEPGEDESHFNQPTDVVVNRAGEAFIADGYINSRIVKFSKEGKYLKSWGKWGRGKGEFDTPHAITIDKHGTLYVADRGNDRIQVFNSDGEYIKEWGHYGLTGGGSGEINDIHWGPDGYLYGVTGTTNKIITFDSQGKIISEWGSKPSTLEDRMNNVRKPVGQFNVLHGLCLDPDGDIYLAEVRSFRAQKITRK